MNDEENFYLFDKIELDEVFQLIARDVAVTFSFLNSNMRTLDEMKKLVKADVENHLKNIIDRKNNAGEFVPKSDFEAFVKGKVK